MSDTRAPFDDPDTESGAGLDPGFDPDATEDTPEEATELAAEFAAEFAADPFGIAELLTSLPTVGPMPAEVVARVSAALAAEGVATSATSAPLPRVAAAQADRPAPVVPLQRHRRSAWPKIVGWGVAAAAAVVLGSAVLPSLLSGGGASSTSAAAPERVNADSGPAAPAAAGSLDGGSGRLISEVDPVPWTADTWIARLVAGRQKSAQTDSPATPYAAAAKPLACLPSVAPSGSPPVRLVSGRYDGRAVVALVLADGSAYLLSPDCSVPTPEVVATGRMP